MGSWEFATGRVIVARLRHGADLLDEVVALAEAHGVTAGALQGLGALQPARLAYYDQAAKVYGELGVDGPVEITNLTGNVSLRDGDVAAHVHLTLAGHDGAALGGHAAAACVVFACELTLTELNGPALERSYDKVTGLPLWREL